MTVRARFMGSLRSLSGKELLTLRLLKSLPLKQVMQKIADEAPKLKQVFDGSHQAKLGTSMLILVNGKEISVLEGLDTTIKKDDELVFVPVLHGG